MSGFTLRRLMVAALAGGSVWSGGCAQPASAPPLPHVISQQALDLGVHVAGLAVGPAGNVWIAALNYGSGPSGAIEMLASGAERRFQRIESFNRVAVDAGRVAWFTVGAGASGQQPKLVRIGRTGQMHDYPLPEEGNFEGITIGPDGVPWFVDAAAGDIGRIAPDGSITYYGPASGDPTEIALSTDGSLWFTEPASNKVGRVTPDGTVTEYAVPTAGSRPTGITAGREGTVWFCESAADKIGRITPGGRFAEFAVPTKDAWPQGIVADRSGNLWFTELMAAKVGRITPSGRIAEFAAPGGGYPGPIMRAPDGSLWMASNAKRDAVLGLTSTRSRLVHFNP